MVTKQRLCSGCHQVAEPAWTYCPSCGATGRVEAKAVKVSSQWVGEAPPFELLVPFDLPDNIVENHARQAVLKRLEVKVQWLAGDYDE